MLDAHAHIESRDSSVSHEDMLPVAISFIHSSFNSMPNRHSDTFSDLYCSFFRVSGAYLV